jgi:hypothetical protein
MKKIIGVFAFQVLENMLSTTPVLATLLARPTKIFVNDQ